MAKNSPPGITPTATTLGRVLHSRINKRQYPAPVLASPAAPHHGPLQGVAMTQQQAVIESALSMALNLVRCHQSPQDLQEATTKTMRACTLLKHQCAQLVGRA